jgi:hypothetical protein
MIFPVFGNESRIVFQVQSEAQSAGHLLNIPAAARRRDNSSPRYFADLKSPVLIRCKRLSQCVSSLPAGRI